MIFTSRAAARSERMNIKFKNRRSEIQSLGKVKQTRFAEKTRSIKSPLLFSGANCTAKREQCDEGEFQCDNGRCINQIWKCDHENDCGDGSDEGKNCKDHFKVCNEDKEFTCNNAKCVPKSRKCDGSDDCGDSSDEVSNYAKHFPALAFTVD